METNQLEKDRLEAFKKFWTEKGNDADEREVEYKEKYFYIYRVN